MGAVAPDEPGEAHRGLRRRICSREEWTIDRTNKDAYVLQPHSLELETLAELGAIGLAWLTAAIGGITWGVVRGVRRDRAVGAAAAGSLGAFFLIASVDWISSFAGLVITAMLVAGAAAGQGRSPCAHGASSTRVRDRPARHSRCARRAGGCAASARQGPCPGRHASRTPGRPRRRHARGIAGIPPSSSFRASWPSRTAGSATPQPSITERRRSACSHGRELPRGRGLAAEPGWSRSRTQPAGGRSPRTRSSPTCSAAPAMAWDNPCHAIARPRHHSIEGVPTAITCRDVFHSYVEYRVILGCLRHDVCPLADHGIDCDQPQPRRPLRVDLGSEELLKHEAGWIGVIGPSPDGQGGISRVIAQIAKIDLPADEPRLLLVTTFRGGGAAAKLGSWLIGLARFAMLCALRRPTLSYVHISSGASTFRKSTFVALSRAMGVPVLLHVHPTSFFDQMEGPGIVGAVARRCVTASLAVSRSCGVVRRACPRRRPRGRGARRRQRTRRR